MEKKKLFKGVYNWTFFTILVAVIIVLNIIGAYLYTRIDVTEDKRYSLADGTIEYLSNKENFSDRVSIKIYLQGKLPAELQRFRNAIEDKLKEFKEYAGSRIEYTFIDPMEGTESDQQYLFETIYNKGRGIIPMGLMYMKDGSQNQMLLWPGAEVDYRGTTVNHIQFLPGTPEGKFYTLNEQFESQLQNSINNLEYMLISAIRRSTQEKKPRIAFLQGHGELTYPETLRARALIEPYYTVEDITINDSISALNNVQGLVIARPTQPFSEKDKYVIDQFVMRGGRLMCFIDKLYLQEDTLNRTGVSHTTRYNLELDRMLYDYGIKVNDNYVLDVRCTKSGAYIQGGADPVVFLGAFHTDIPPDRQEPRPGAAKICFGSTVRRQQLQRNVSYPDFFNELYGNRTCPNDQPGNAYELREKPKACS